jgi:putative hemolysin
MTSAAVESILDALPTCAPFSECLPPDGSSLGNYRFAFARSRDELLDVLRLRHAVFVEELGQGLAANAGLAVDVDPFDPWFHHVVVRHVASGAAVGCYRLQTHAQASASGVGWYAASEFDLSTLGNEFLHAAVEIGRACIHPEHRNAEALLQLWAGLAAYARHNDKRHLFGCSSIPGSDVAAAAAAYWELEECGAFHPSLRVQPRDACRMDFAHELRGTTEAGLPPLLASYLRLGAVVLGGPAMDREFGTIDFLTSIDLATMARRTARFFGAQPMPE